MGEAVAVEAGIMFMRDRLAVMTPAPARLSLNLDIFDIRTSAGMFLTETIVLFKFATLHPGSDHPTQVWRNGGRGAGSDRDS